ncbi:hypothetical protein [Rhizohabitans arisaemae]|uniref:hypothetical protein n=1 Tax=Rhizohabitans arisaemae TaxID=2720610 RepID=UPI0024B15AC6|nr:hypothetical protein [Rhizohabitans arisaemae]
MNADERDEHTRLLPHPVVPPLTPDRHRQLKEFMMTEIRNEARPTGWRRLRPAVVVPALAAAAAAAVAVPLLLGGTAAHAVAEQADGTFRITINEANDPKGLQEELREAGLNAVVDYVPQGKRCSPQPRSTGYLPNEEADLVSIATDGNEPAYIVDPSVVKPGQTAVLEFNVTTAGENTMASVFGRVSTGPVAECELVDSDEAPLGPLPTG